jgi:rSAM/selenodomain-associated transferase 1
MNNNILLFIKYPKNGGVKTRLAKSIGDAAAVSLYKCFVEDILSSLQGLNAHIWICYYPENAKDDMAVWLGSSYYYVLQKGGNLGKRMQHCFKSSFDKGFEKTIVLASDIPEISENIINNAFKSLEYKDAVIGPSYDGGYYLMGFNKKSYTTEVFDEISWSTNLVYEETLRKIEEYNLRYSVLDKINDMDTIEDIRKFSSGNRKDFSRGLKTERCIKALFDKAY